MRPKPGVAATAVLALALSGCGDAQSSPEENQPVPTIQEVKAAHEAAWMELPGVTGVGIGLCEGAECIRVFLTEASEEVREAIPDRVEGYPVDLEITGSFRARPPPGGGP